jgi:3-hydroxyacyl-[acyl-carrier-protein] dehydratase
MRDHGDIRAVLPQRHPLLLVDRVLELVPGRSIRTVKAITGTDPCYAALPDGAGDRCYDYPFSLMIESFGQSAALLWLDGRLPDPGDDKVLMFVGARDFGFHGTARPGDVLRHEVRLDSVVADTAFASGETWVGDRRVATVDTLIATRRSVRPADPVPPAVPAARAGARSTDGAVTEGKVLR